MGIAALPLFLGALHGLQRLWPQQGLSRDIWLAYHEDLRTSPPAGRGDGVSGGVP